MNETQTQNKSIVKIGEELENFYNFLNEKFKLQLPKNLVITIQQAGRKNAKGWFHLNIWETDNKEEIHEINICAETLLDKPLETLTHEIAHFCEYKETGKIGKNNYHNKTFKKYAELLNLKVTKGKYGWCITESTDAFNQMVREFKPKKEVFTLLRKTEGKTKQPTKMKKYICDCTTIRCATELNATCKNCKMDFVGG